jgi:hypothetical protein
MTNDKRIGGLRNLLVSHSEPVRLILRVSSRHMAMTNEILHPINGAGLDPINCDLRRDRK